MNKPYIICHMMTSVDGRIDCAMTSQLPGMSRTIIRHWTNWMFRLPWAAATAELEMAEPGFFEAKILKHIPRKDFLKSWCQRLWNYRWYQGKAWPDASDMDKPYLIITSEQVTKEYLAYLDGQHISWIACGKERSISYVPARSSLLNSA